MNIEIQYYIDDTDCNLFGLKKQISKKFIKFIFTSKYEENMKFLEQIDLPIDSILKSLNPKKEIYIKGYLP